jgi:mannose-6-phosphate isomerase-like protein (cupin superfamily)
MIIRRETMKQDFVEKMRGGEGTIEITHLVAGEDLPHARLMANITIPVGAAIGEHAHKNETEYYILTEGEGVVRDNGSDQPVRAGEVVVTPDGSTHSIVNTGSTPLKMVAVIILD